MSEFTDTICLMENGVFKMLEKHYLGFTMKYKKKLYEEWAIDCGYDYAKFISEEFKNEFNIKIKD
jgi:hypothetical protein